MHSFECHSSLFYVSYSFQSHLHNTRVASLYCIMNITADLTINYCRQSDHAFLSRATRSWRHDHNVSIPMLRRKRPPRLSCPVHTCPLVTSLAVLTLRYTWAQHVTAPLTVTGNLFTRRHLDDVMKWMCQSVWQRAWIWCEVLCVTVLQTNRLTQVPCVVLCQPIIPQRCY